jgi:hypothetical protein
MYKDRVVLPAQSEFPQKIFSNFHDTPIGGHSGFLVSYQKIKRLFSWTGMKQMIKTWCSQCPVCQQAKVERVKYPGLLQPLPIPDGAWKMITMNFIEGLPMSDHSNCIMVVVDKFSKYSHFVPLCHPFTALGVAHHFMDNIFKLHGFPSTIITDRDRIFTSALWKEMFKIAGVELRFTTAYHPQSDSQLKRVNQCLETYLRCFAQACPTKWKKWLSLAEFWYNTSYHSSLQLTPFEVLYGYPPRHLGVDFRAACDVPSLQVWLDERKVVVQLVQQQLARAQLRQKTQADKHRIERTFQIGDWVYLKLQSYVQASLVRRANHKLAFKFFGPYQVIAKIGSVAYKLNLPDSCHIHPVFHVSLLKKAVGPHDQASSPLPVLSDSLHAPEKVLQRRILRRSTGDVPQLLIQWSSWPTELATWEDELTIKQRFPDATAWGQAGIQGEENVTVPEENVKVDRPTRIRKPNSKVSGPDWTQ